jgi:hypothetical protein
MKRIIVFLFIATLIVGAGLTQSVTAKSRKAVEEETATQEGKKAAAKHEQDINDKQRINKKTDKETRRIKKRKAHATSKAANNLQRRGTRKEIEADKRNRDRETAKKRRQNMRLTPEEEERTLNLIREHRPWDMERVEKLKSNNRMEYNRLLRRTMMLQKRLERLRDEDPEAYQRRIRESEFEKREHELSLRYNKAVDKNEKKEIEKELAGVLEEHFELRTENHRIEIERVETDLKKLKNRLNTRNKNRKRIIELMMSKLKGDGDPLEF